MTQTATAAANPEIGNSVRAAGIRTNYHDRGSGAPVLLIHGSGPGVSAWANWRGVLPELAETRRVIAPDIVGFGYTEHPEGYTFSRQAWVDHLAGLLDALELEKVSIVGNSFGGALALWLADQFPERVDRLALMGSVGTRFEITPGLDAVWGYEPSVENMQHLLELFAYDQSLLGPDLAQLRYEASVRDGVHESYSAMFPTPRQNGVDALALDDDALSSLPHDTLIVHGRDDKVIPLSASLRLHELIARSQLHVFGQCGHWTQIEKRDEFVQLLGNFLPA
ncbi:alpha/beta fold hydrolase [Pseudonocardia parietis]|uniref:2-hydroxymuconate-semialdehyde hydrolase n=1 Tax=Pseudonocardia parietis TaxID=570936 RepID=A0ABS4VMA5_9PSEU|nr:alpha/beta hydrolase [Pseudonocardia parietis]MBP2365058.1 2-hydroxymuconate-semialdehyde hydrolase [Pseudonocardia parietis]